MAKKWICTVCGYVHEGDTPPEKCPQCKQPAEKFKELKEDEEVTYAAEHVIGVAKGVDPEILAGLKAHFEGECSEVGMYLAMSRQADREGSNLEKRMAAEAGACEDKFRIAKLAKAQNLDAIHDTVHEMARDEARHGQGFTGLYNRFFKK